MRRFFIDPENIAGAHAVLTGSEARHIHTVLRLATGTTVTLFDGSGSYFEALLTKISPSRVEARIISISPYLAAEAGSHSSLHLGLGLLKGKKMDFIIQKMTELGIECIYPFRSDYCAAIDGAAGRLGRWRKIALEACKQCNRPKPPSLVETMDFKELLSLSGTEKHELKLIFWEAEGQKPLREILDPAPEAKSALVLIGPEGGFSSTEVAAAVAAGFQPVSLGRRILRAETAAIAAASILQYELGNLA